MEKVPLSWSERGILTYFLSASEIGHGPINSFKLRSRVIYYIPTSNVFHPQHTVEIKCLKFQEAQVFIKFHLFCNSGEIKLKIIKPKRAYILTKYSPNTCWIDQLA